MDPFSTLPDEILLEVCKNMNDKELAKLFSEIQYNCCI